MGTADAPGFDIPSGVEDRFTFFPDIGAIPGAVPDAAFMPFTQRILELAISSAGPTDAVVATDMGIPGSVLTEIKKAPLLNLNWG